MYIDRQPLKQLFSSPEDIYTAQRELIYNNTVLYSRLFTSRTHTNPTDIQPAKKYYNSSVHCPRDTLHAHTSPYIPPLSPCPHQSPDLKGGEALLRPESLGPD